MSQTNLGNPILRLAVRAALTTGTLAASFGVAQSQEAPAGTGDLGEVVVTGSRIAVPNQTSISPVTFVSATDIAQTGATRIEDVLNQLPQVFADQGSNIVNGSDGTATVNLRGLNAKRTLVLVDGFRMGPGDPNSSGASDINMIPMELLESVEVMTGGATTVYGADAVAGVVNFKLNDHFEGVKLIADAGEYNHHNNNVQGVEDAIAAAGDQEAPSHVNTGSQKSLAFIAGLNSADGNGNATFYATYRNVAAVLQSKYSQSACTLGSGYIGSGSYSTGGKFYCGGSSTSYPGRFEDLATTPRTNSTVTATGQLVPYTSANSYNYGALNYYQRPDERYTGGTLLHYQFNEHATVYSESMFMDDRSVAQIAPSGAFFKSYTFNCSNPELSASELAAWCGGSAAGNTSILIGRRNIEGGDRQDDLEHTDYHEVLGIKGKISDAWSYDASFQYSLVNLAETYNNDVSSEKITDALNVVTGANGQPECAVTAAGDTNGLANGCVPWNIFKAGGVTQAAANYITTPGEERGRVTQTVVNANATGDLAQYGLQLPTASSGLKLNLGAEYRDVTSFTSYDQEYLSGDLAGQGGAKTNTSGGIVSREVFVEAYLPLIDDKPFAKSLDFTTGYRYSDYSTGFETNTFKFGLDWSPSDDVRIRGSFARASRAPNIVELYSASSVALDGNTDPCAGTNPSYSAAQCARTGVTAAQYGNILPNTANQYNGLTGGNTALKPETAFTTSFGIGFTPRFIPNFRAQFDYFDIKIDNVIQQIGADEILKECLNSDLFCNAVHRDSDGSLWTSENGYVVDQLENVGKLQTRGVDADISYSFDIGPLGKIHTGLVGTYVDKYEITPIAALGTTAYNCAGYYGTACSSTTSGAGTPVYHWRNKISTTWSTPWSGLDLTVAWRFYSAVKNEQLSPNTNISAAAGATVANTGISSTDANISSYNYIDLSAAIRLSEKLSLRMGVNNLLDKDPPVIGSSSLPSTSGNGNTFPQVYDSLGRYIFAQVTAQF